MCGLEGLWFGSEEKVDTNNQTGGEGREGIGGPRDLLLFKIQAATSCWEFRMRQGRMEPRGSGASQVGQRPWSSSLEILCWFCLLPFCWWVREKQMLHTFFFFLPIPTGTIPVQGLYCTGSSLTAAVRVAKARRGPGTDRQVGGYAHAGAHCLLTHSFTPWVALVIHDIHLPCGNVGGAAAAALIPLVSRSAGSC